MLERFPDDWNYLETEKHLAGQGYSPMTEHPDWWINKGRMEEFLGNDFHLSHLKVLKYFGLSEKDDMDFLESLMNDLGYRRVKTRSAFVKRSAKAPWS